MIVSTSKLTKRHRAYLSWYRFNTRQLYQYTELLTFRSHFPSKLANWYIAFLLFTREVALKYRKKKQLPIERAAWNYACEGGARRRRSHGVIFIRCSKRQTTYKTRSRSSIMQKNSSHIWTSRVRVGKYRYTHGEQLHSIRNMASGENLL